MPSTNWNNQWAALRIFANQTGHDQEGTVKLHEGSSTALEAAACNVAAPSLLIIPPAVNLSININQSTLSSLSLSLSLSAPPQSVTN